ncbi:MAG: SAF domain-containing protein [Acidimicrobiales bacterium]
MAATVQNGKQDDLVSGTPFDLAAAQTGKAKSRVPEILVGTFLVALFALAGAWFYSTSTQSTAYVALREDVVRGQVISELQLTVYELNTEAPIRGIRGVDFATIVGEVALADMQAGTLVTEDQFAEKSQIPSGFGIVGLDLSPGEFPTLSLRPGDRVRVVIMPKGGDVTDPESVVVVDDDVEVVEVVDGGSRDRFISLTMPAALADQVAAADSEDRIRLIQVPGG